MAEYLIQDTTLTNIANEIRTMHGTTEAMMPSAMIDKLNDANEKLNEQESILVDIATALEGKIAINGSLVSQATPTLNISSDGLITATSTQNAGYINGGTRSSTKQLAIQTAQTIVPSTIDQTIELGQYLTGTQTIKGDANLVAENIKSGISIFGVNGSYGGSGGGSSGDVEMCTVSVAIDQSCFDSGEMGYPIVVPIYVTYVDEEFQLTMKDMIEVSEANTPVVLAENVVKGTVFSLDLYYMDPGGVFCSSISPSNEFALCFGGSYPAAHSFIVKDNITDVTIFY